MILQALEMGAKLRQEKLHLRELGIATLNACFVNANRDTKKGEPSKPSDFFYFQVSEDKKAEIPSAAADVFFSLISDEILPGWSLGIAPLDQLRKVKKDNPVVHPRAWVGEGVLLLLPVVEESIVRSPLAILDGVSGLVSVCDIDSGTAFTIVVETSDRRWVLDAEIPLENH